MGGCGEYAGAVYYASYGVRKVNYVNAMMGWWWGMGEAGHARCEVVGVAAYDGGVEGYEGS